MPQPIEISILNKIKKAKRGSLFFIENFIDFGNTKTVGKTLERLVKSGELKRIARGIYFRPMIDPIIGPITPGIETIAKAIAKRDRARIVPTGIYALNQLGLSTQIPLNVIYLTDGAARTIKIGSRTITFKKTAPKNLITIGEISSLVIQALKTIGKDKATKQEIEKVIEVLKKENPAHIKHDLKLAPEWIRKIMLAVIKEDIK